MSGLHSMTTVLQMVLLFAMLFGCSFGTPAKDTATELSVSGSPGKGLLDCINEYRTQIGVPAFTEAAANTAKNISNKNMVIACSETNYESDGSFNKDDWIPSVATSFIMSKVTAFPATDAEFHLQCKNWWNKGAFFQWSETSGKACYAEANPKNIAELRKKRNFMQMVHAGSGAQTISCASIDCALTNSGKKVLYCELKPAFDIESKVFNKENFCKMKSYQPHVYGCNGANVNCEAPTPTTNKTTTKQPVASGTSPGVPHVVHSTPLADAAEQVISPLMVAFGAPLILTLTLAINQHLF